MKSSVQLGLLCLSLFISSLHGDEVEAESSQETFLNFEEPDSRQLEMYRVRRQTEKKAKTVAVVPSSDKKINTGWPRPGGLSPLGDSGNPTMVVYHRTKRQEKSKTNKRKKRPGSQSLLGTQRFVPLPQQPAKVKRDAGGERLLPES